MAHKQHGAPLLGNVAHFPQALALKIRVADSQHFIHHQNLRFQMRRDRESEPQVHAAGIAFDRSVNELSDFRKIDNFIKAGQYFFAGHAQNRAVEKDILPSGQFRMKASAHFQQRAHAPAQFAIAFGRVRDARENLEQGAFTGAVAPDDAKRLSLPDVESDVLERPDGVRGFSGAPLAREALPDALHLVGDEVAQGIRALLRRADFVALGNDFYLDGIFRSVHQTTSAKVFSMRRKKNKPLINSSTTAALEIASVKSGGVPPNKAHRKPCTTPTIGLRL